MRDRAQGESAGRIPILKGKRPESDIIAKVAEKSSIYERFKAAHPGYWATYNARYYSEHADEIKARTRANYQKKKAAYATRYLVRREAIAERNRTRRQVIADVLRARARAGYARDPHSAIARANKRRALKSTAAIGTDRAAYQAFVKLVRQAEMIACHWCRAPVPASERRIDHIIPLVKGGPDAVENLCCACRLCNARKGDKLPSEWMEDG
jgi:5-methylcytosine-specific restriction endonuclease McrA